MEQLGSTKKGGLVMKAFMSGPNEFGTANDYIRHCRAEVECPALRHNASATEAWTQVKQRMALREAQRILAETEPMLDGYVAADRKYLGPIGGPVGLLPEERIILAASLASFIVSEVGQ